MANDVVRGVVEKLNKNRAYSVLLDNGQWYGAGFEESAITFSEGDTIEFEYETKGKYKNIVINTVKVVEAPKTKASPKKASSSAVSGRDDYWANKEQRDLVVQKEIRLQASRNSAISFVDMLLDKDLVKIPAKVAAKVPAIEELVEFYTYKFYDETLDVVNQEGSFNATVANAVDEPTTDDEDYE